MKLQLKRGKLKIKGNTMKLGERDSPTKPGSKASTRPMTRKFAKYSVGRDQCTYSNLAVPVKVRPEDYYLKDFVEAMLERRNMTDDERRRKMNTLRRI